MTIYTFPIRPSEEYGYVSQMAVGYTIEVERAALMLTPTATMNKLIELGYLKPDWDANMTLAQHDLYWLMNEAPDFTWPEWMRIIRDRQQNYSIATQLIRRSGDTTSGRYGNMNQLWGMFPQMPHHFITLSEEKPDALEYTPDARHGIEGRRKVVSVRGYLEKHIYRGPVAAAWVRHYRSYIEELIEHWSASMRTSSAYKLVFLSTADDIAMVYHSGPGFRSCMRGDHFRIVKPGLNIDPVPPGVFPCSPAYVYGAGDLELAVMVANDVNTDRPVDKWMANIQTRCLVWRKNKMRNRIYSISDRATNIFTALLSGAGLRHVDTLSGARLLAIPLPWANEGDHKGYVMPYTDCGSYAVYDKSTNMFILNGEEKDRGTAVPTRQANGVAKLLVRPECEKCGKMTALQTVHRADRTSMRWCRTCVGRVAEVPQPDGYAGFKVFFDSQQSIIYEITPEHMPLETVENRLVSPNGTVHRCARTGVVTVRPQQVIIGIAPDGSFVREVWAEVNLQGHAVKTRTGWILNEKVLGPNQISRLSRNLTPVIDAVYVYGSELARSQNEHPAGYPTYDEPDDDDDYDYNEDGERIDEDGNVIDEPTGYRSIPNVWRVPTANGGDMFCEDEYMGIVDWLHVASAQEQDIYRPRTIRSIVEA